MEHREDPSGSVMKLQLDQLTAEMAWIRRLALALVHDASTADDVAQEAWIAAAGRVPEDRPLRPWLSRVVLNVVRMRSRSAKRREVREAAVPECATTPMASELIDRVELQRKVAGEVLALDEPYRSTVLLHYFEGLSCAEIARQLDIPDGTVRRRLKHALDQLRGRLARDDRRGWIAILAPLVTPPGESTAVAGRIAMKKIVVGCALLLLLIVGGSWWWRGGRSDGNDGVATTPAGATPGRGSGPGVVSAEVATGAWFTQTGGLQRKVAGKVTFRGQPVAGAIVRLGTVTAEAPTALGGGRLGDEVTHKITGADGGFDFGAVPAATFVVSAEADGKTPASLAIATADPTGQPQPDRIVLELGDCASRLFGQVVDSSGGGVAKARLRVVGLGGADANATGEYSLCVPMGDSRVRIEADGYGATEKPIHLVGELKQDFELVPESVLVGMVVDEGGHGVPHARVIALPQLVEQPHGLGDGATIADADGKFRITNLAPGRFLLAAVADGYGTATPKPAIAAPGAGHEITLVVAQRARVTGRVMMGGAPVAGARIAMANKDLLARAAYSQADGKFVLDGVPFGTLHLDAGSFAVIGPKEIKIDKPAVDVTVEVSELASLVGRVIRKGQPVPDAVIRTSLGITTRSGADGAYELRGLPAGNIQVTAQAFGAVNAFSPFLPVAIVPGKQTTHDIELTGAAEVHGVVVDEAGAPVPNVYVRLIDGRGDLGESMTDTKGAFECTSMLGGAEYRMAVFPSPGARQAFALASGKPDSIQLANGDTVLRDVKIAIEYAPLAIAGRVVDDHGAAVADVHVEAIGQGVGGLPMIPSVRADANGQFQIANLAKGSYTLHAHAGDGSEVEVVGIAAGATGVRLELVRPGAIEGELVGFTKLPQVTARQVTATLLVGNDAVIEGTKFSITGLVPGKYVVEAIGGDENDGESVVVKSGQTVRVKLENRGRSTVEGTVTELGTKTPIAGMNCVAAQSFGGQAGQIQPGPATPGATTDAKGEFKIPAPVGKARVMCFPPAGEYSVAGGDAEVPATTPGHIDLAAVRAIPPPSDPGFRIKPITLPLVIAAVDPAGPAKGVMPGDRVVSIDGVSLAGLLPSSAMMLASNHRAGTVLILGIERNGTPMTFKIVVQKRTD